MTDARRWRIDGGSYKVAVGKAADDLELTGEATLADALFSS